MQISRINTVSSISRQTTRKEYQVPYIRLSGLWLNKLGIQPGGKIEVKIDDGAITIRPVPQ